jgi:aspartate carbamoyltransferase
MTTPETITVDGIELRQLTEEPASWVGSSMLSATQITSGGLKLLLTVTEQMRELVKEKGGDNRLQHTIVGTVFFEASTRTACSFQAAAMRLGGNNIHVDGGGNTSAGKKGESLEDTIQCLECYTDLTVLRHPVTGSVGKVIQIAKKPVLNAGDGVGEHPTQALLDVFTIYDELQLAGNSKGPLTVVLLGDLKNGRTVHSLAKLLCVTAGILWEGQLTLRLCSPSGLELPDCVRDFCATFESAGVKQETYTDPTTACQGANVLYVTRIQRERFESDEAYDCVKVSCRMGLRLMTVSHSGPEL